MKFSYQFSNLLGTVYRQGDILFTSNGNTVICPVGNKISLYDLKHNRSRTLPIEARYDYTTLALSPNQLILIAAEEDGEVHVINMNFKKILYRKKFDRPIRKISFSPDGKHFALCKENSVFVYNAPGANKRVFDPFVLERVYHGSYGDSTCIDWSFDSKLLLIGSKDGSTRVCALARFTNFSEFTIGGNTKQIIGAYFDENSLDAFTVSSNGHINAWKCSVTSADLIPAVDIYRSSQDETKSKDKETIVNVDKDGEQMEEDVDKDGEQMEEDQLPPSTKEIEENKKKVDDEVKTNNRVVYKRRFRIFLDEHLKIPSHQLKVTSATYHKGLKLLVVACSHGDFLIFSMLEEGNLISSLNISKQTISSVCFNATGDWLALGVSTLGELVVWEWQSETYILKQQGHEGLRVTAYSPDGRHLVTGDDQGKVKMWSTESSFCFVTFKEHKSAITGLVFTQSGRAVLSSSLDGTVRAFDLTRYRNFKILTSPDASQFSCVAVDTSGELVVAGGQDSHLIYLWSLQTGRLLTELEGHTSPVTSIQFSQQPGSTMLVSTAWDNTVKVWNAIANTTAKETINLTSSGLCIAIRPDGQQVAVATFDGQITMFNTDTGTQEGNIVGRKDLGAGRSDSDKITAQKNLNAKSFKTLCYSSDGLCLLAGGESKNVCIYSVAEELLIKKFEVTQSRSYGAMDEVVNRKKMAESGINLALVEGREVDGSGGTAIKLPGTRTGDKSTRIYSKEVRVTSLIFSPTGRSWAACSNDGLLIYSMDNDWLFDPIQLDMTITPSEVKQKLLKHNYSTALMMAIKLNIKTVKQEVLESIPLDSVDIIISGLPKMYLEGLLNLLAELIDTSRHLGLYTHWVNAILIQHGPGLKQKSKEIMSTINNLQRALSTHYNNFNKLCSHNEYTMKYLISQGTLRQKDAIYNEQNNKEEEDKENNILALFDDEEMET